MRLFITGLLMASAAAAANDTPKTSSFIYQGNCLVTSDISAGAPAQVFANLPVSLNDGESKIIYNSNGLTYKVTAFSVGTPKLYTLELDVVQDGKPIPAGALYSSSTNYESTANMPLGVYTYGAGIYELACMAL